MIAYILKSSLSLLIMFGLYWFLLRQEKLFIFNRFFLIFAVLFSLVIPFISIPVNIQDNDVQKNIVTALNSNIPAFSQKQNLVSNFTYQPYTEIKPSSEDLSSGINFLQILLILYASGVILLLIRFLRNIFFISHQKRLSEKITYSGQKLVLIDHQINPFCFFNAIFVSKQDYLNNKIGKELLTHELEHISQSHSIDVIFIELIQIIYWFNPILFLYNRAIRVNHEYLADNGVIQDSPDIKIYADKLINFISCNRNIPLTSGFNPSLTRKRLIMLTKSKPNKIKDGVRIFMTFNLVAVFFLILSCIPSNSQPLKMVMNPEGLTGAQLQRVKDIDGNEYKTVKIGTQVWMAENLKTTKYNDGTEIPRVSDDNLWQKYEPAFSWYNNDESENKNKYGALYNWYAVSTNKLCPTGWHVPSKSELSVLTNFNIIDTLSGGKLKEVGTVHWKSPNKGATNETGFTALPGGYRHYSGEFKYLGEYGNWWSTTGENTYVANCWTLMHAYRGMGLGAESKRDGLSVRCVKDFSEEEIKALKIQRDSILDAITAADFSGKWELKQSPYSKELTSSTLIVTQEANTITLQGAFDFLDRKPVKKKLIYYLDGKEIKTKSGERTQKVSAEWSLNKQSFAITTIILSPNKGSIQEIKYIETYSLTRDGKGLIVHYNDNINPQWTFYNRK